MKTIDEMVYEHLTFLQSQNLITECVWIVKEGRITFKLRNGVWWCGTNFETSN